uniref:NR LBD domain-containing protein n=1 Tax=Caenorhabditis tropicalis TaxID=1561998 RepID=A0A1I7T1N0_9PELO
MDTFTGRSNLIIFCASRDGETKKKFINVQGLIDKAAEVLTLGAETPVFAPNSLEKLALGLPTLRQKNHIRKVITRVGQEETFQLWENDLLKVAKWLTYFDEFQQLPLNLKMDMLKGIWIIWGRLDKLSTMAYARRHRIVGDQQAILEIGENQIIFEMGTLDIDLSWCSRYSFEQLKFFGQPKLDTLRWIANQLISLELTEVELTYMFCQLSLHHVGKRYGGEIQEVSERLQESLSNDLHDYYSNRLRMERYADRVSNMMKVNNGVRFWNNQRRQKMELMNVFDVFYVEYSDPDMFLDF